jgi:hypothetical protein
MPYPDIYDIGYNYTGFQQSQQGISAFPGTQLDHDLAGLRSSVSSVALFVRGVLRSDGALNNGAVTYDSLSAGLQTAGIAPAVAWTTATYFAAGRSVVQGGILYRALVSHTSGVFTTDLAAGKWLLISSLLTSTAEQTYAALADAVADVIAPNVAIVKLLGRNAPGDAIFTMDFIRIGDATPAAWRFVDAGGQPWGLLNRNVTPEMFHLGGLDYTATFQSMAQWLELPGVIGPTIDFYPGAEYKVWPTGTAPSILFSLSDVHDITFNFNGAKITTNNPFDLAGFGIVVLCQDCSNLKFYSPRYEQTGYLLPLDFNRGGRFLNFNTQNNRRIQIYDMYQKGGIAGLTCATGNYTALATHDISLFGAHFDTVYYPLSFQMHGDGFFARGVKVINCGRGYFIYGVSSHDVEIFSNGGPSAHDNVLLKQYAFPTASLERNTLSDITVRYSNYGQDSANNLPALVSLEFQQPFAPMLVTGAAAIVGGANAGKTRLSVDSTANAASGQTWFFNAIGGTVEANGRNAIIVIDATHIDLPNVVFVHAWTAGGYARVPAGMKNIKILLDVNDITGNGQPAAVLTRKYTYDTVADTGVNGYIVENIEIGGTLKNYNAPDVYGVGVLNLFTNTALPGPIGTWPGETVRNIILRDFSVRGGNSSVTIDATAVSNLVIENVNSSSTVPWTVTDPNNTVRQTNVSITGLADRRAIAISAAVANQFVTGTAPDGSLLRAQPSVSNLSDGTTGSGAVVRATSPALVTPNLGTPSTVVLTNATGSAAGLTAGNVITNANMSGDVSSVGNVTSIGAHKVTRAMQVQGAARSVIGVTGSATADVADIQGAASQFFGVNAAGTALAFQTMSGDATLSGGAIAVSKTGGVSFGTLSTLTPGTGVATALAINIGAAGAPVTNGGALGSPSSAGTLPALALGGTISGGGNQLNNIIIGTTTPLAASFTNVAAATSVTVSGSSANSLRVGTATPIFNGGALTVASLLNAYAEITNGGNGGVNSSLLFGADVSGTFFGSYGSTDLVMRVNNTERARLTVAGGFAVGSSSDPGPGNITATGAIQTGSFTVGTLPSGVTARLAFCSNCRMFNGAGVQEGGGAGTGGHVSYNSSAWKIAGTNVTAVS